MLTAIVGWFFICMGTLFAIKPQILQKRLQKKSYKKIRGLLFVLTICAGGLLVSVGLKHQGILPKIIMILGIFGLIKAFWLLKAKTAEKLLEWSAKLPILWYRVGGCCHILIGVAILTIR